jgi:hypothetical protein
MAPMPMQYNTAIEREVVLKAWKSSLITRGHSSSGPWETVGQACVGSNEKRILRCEHSVTLRVTPALGSVVPSVPWQ